MHQSEQNYILSNVEGFIYYRAKTFRSCLFLLIYSPVVFFYIYYSNYYYCSMSVLGWVGWHGVVWWWLTYLNALYLLTSSWHVLCWQNKSIKLLREHFIFKSYMYVNVFLLLVFLFFKEIVSYDLAIMFKLFSKNTSHIFV